MPRSKTFFLALLILTVQPLGCGGGGGGSEILPPVPAPIPALTVSTVTLPPRDSEHFVFGYAGRTGRKAALHMG